VRPACHSSDLEFNVAFFTQDKEIQKRKASLTLIRSHQSNVESSGCTAEVEAEHALAELESHTKNYNTVARKLQLLPYTAKYANTTCFEAEIKPCAQTAEVMVHQNLHY